MGQPQEQEPTRDPVFKVVDVLDHPHGGRIARLRIESGDIPEPDTLRGTTLRGTGPSGEERIVKVLGLSLTGGRASHSHARKSGRMDLHVEEEGEGAPVDLTWRLTPT